MPSSVIRWLLWPAIKLSLFSAEKPDGIKKVTSAYGLKSLFDQTLELSLNDNRGSVYAGFTAALFECALLTVSVTTAEANRAIIIKIKALL